VNCSGGSLIRGPGGCRPEWQTVQGGLALGPEGVTVYHGTLPVHTREDVWSGIRLGSAIEQLNRYGAFICKYKNRLVYYRIGWDGGLIRASWPVDRVKEGSET